MAAKPIMEKSFKGISYYVYQESPKAFCITIGDIRRPTTSFYIAVEDKIGKITRAAINQIKKYSQDGVISKVEKLKIDQYIAKVLEAEDASIKTLTPITSERDITAGCVIMPRDVDIVAVDDLYIVEAVEDNKNCRCINVNTSNKTSKTEIEEKILSLNDIISGYLVIDYVDSIRDYVNYKRQIDTLEKYFINTIKAITTDINETSTTTDANPIMSYISNAILESNYNGFLKEQMLSLIEKKLK